MKLGLTGPIGSGKGEVTKILISRGFFYISLSDVVREEAKRRNIELKRKNLQELGNSLRREFGPGILGRIVRERIESERERDWVIDGIRNPYEVEELRKMEDFFLIAVTAPIDVLIERVVRRGRAEDPESIEEIREKILREMGDEEPSEGQRIKDCMGISDFTILNVHSLEYLKEEVEKIIGTILETFGGGI
ncbi:MAG: AAA family ATPase [Candidatus Aminicenantia bacterium]